MDESLEAIVLSVHFFVIYIDDCAGPHPGRHEPPLGIHGFLMITNLLGYGNEFRVTLEESGFF
jgi:hypothetical protein